MADDPRFQPGAIIQDGVHAWEVVSNDGERAMLQTIAGPDMLVIACADKCDCPYGTAHPAYVLVREAPVAPDAVPDWMLAGG